MNRNLSPSTAAQIPTRVRYGVLGFACTLSMITYLDRVCIGSAAEHLWTVLGYNSIEDIKLALTAFSVAYAVFEIPSGWLGDMFGPRNVLIRIVLWWSVFTALTGTVGLWVAGMQIGFWALVAIRFLFGMGEAGAYPNITRALHNWFPFRERGLAQGFVWMAGRGMGGLTPLLWMLLVEGGRQIEVRASGEKIETFLLFKPPADSWRMSFWLFGGIGAIWCVLFWWWFRNRPEQKASVNQAEMELIRADREEEAGVERGVPWMRLLTSRNLWALCLMYFCASYAWYFNINYLPTFLKEQHGVQSGNFARAIYAGGPLWMGAVACLLGGWLTDRFIRRTGDRKWGRRWFGLVGHGVCALCYLGCLAAPGAVTFFLAISFAAFFNDLTMGAAWATCQDIGKRYAAIVAGCMNTIGNLGGAAGTFMTGYILKVAVARHETVRGVSVDALSGMEQAEFLREAHVLGYQINFISFAVVYFLAMLLWFVIDATKPVADEA
jgi:ACS family glucarate transporter-like MFS transporter